MAQRQKFQCQADGCGEWSEAEFHYDQRYGEQTVTCSKCGTKHLAIQIPTPDGHPAQFEIKLPSNGR